MHFIFIISLVAIFSGCVEDLDLFPPSTPGDWLYRTSIEEAKDVPANNTTTTTTESLIDSLEAEIEKLEDPFLKALFRRRIKK